MTGHSTSPSSTSTWPQGVPLNVCRVSGFAHVPGEFLSSRLPEKGKVSDAPALFCLSSPALLCPTDEVKALLSPASLEVKAATSVCRSQWASRTGQPSLPHPLTLPGWAWESRGHRAQGRVGRAGRAEEPGHGATFERRRLPACRLPRGQASWGGIPCALS